MSGNGERQAPPESMSAEERSIQILKHVRALHASEGELYQNIGSLAKETATNTRAVQELTAAIRAGRVPSTPPPPVTQSILPPSRDRQQSYLDLEAISRQASNLLNVDSDVGENTKVTQITSNAQLLLGVIEQARVNAYNKLQRNARLKTIAVWVGIVGGAIPVVTVFAALCLWVLRLALAYLGK